MPAAVRRDSVPATKVIHRRPLRGGRPLVVALACVAVLALVAGAVALLRIDRRDAAPITTNPPATTVPAVDDAPVWYDPARVRWLHRSAELLMGRDKRGAGMTSLLRRARS